MHSSDSPFSKSLDIAASHAQSYLQTLTRSPVGAQANAQALRERLGKSLSDGGVPAEQVIEDLVAGVRDGLHGTGGGRFFAWVIGGCLPAALAADWLTSAWDQNAHCFATGPAAAIVEEVVGEWLKELFGLPSETTFALVTGCQMAHTTCLAAARHDLLARRGWDVEWDGLYGAPPIRILSSHHAHGSIDRALRFLGLGMSHWTRLPADSRGRLAPEVLAAALSVDSSAPTVVVLQAGDLNIGAFDDFEKLIPIAKRHGAWVHVDGAFGLWASTSTRYRHLLNGVAAADSWATDGHKWLNVPYDCGYALVAHPQSHFESMAHRASYISYSSQSRDESDWNPEWSRRARGFATYAAIRQLGRQGIAEMIERCCDHARAMALGIGNLPGAEVVSVPQINQGLIRFRDPRPGATAADHDRRTDEIIARINADGEAFFSGTTWQGGRAMRVSVCGWQTSESDVQRAIAATAEALNAHPL